jgi:hypothetical protein
VGYSNHDYYELGTPKYAKELEERRRAALELTDAKREESAAAQDPVAFVGGEEERGSL